MWWNPGEVENHLFSKESPSLLGRPAPTDSSSLHLDPKGYRRHEKTEAPAPLTPPPLLTAAASFSSPRRASLDNEKRSGQPTAIPALVPSIIPWPQLPPCPIPGFYVTEDGVWETKTTGNKDVPPSPSSPPCDTEKNPKEHHDPNGCSTLGKMPTTPSAFSLGIVATPPSSSSVLLTRDAFRERIHQLQHVEQQAKIKVDDQLPDQVRMRSLRGLEVVVNTLLFGVGVYWMTWKSARLYQGAIPRQSLFFTKALAFFRRFPMSTTKREDVARRHRRWMQATNANVTGSFVVGLFLTSFAWYTRPVFTSLDDTPEAKQNQQVVWCRQVSSAGLKWMWFLYFHHPAYARTSPTRSSHCIP